VGGGRLTPWENSGRYEAARPCRTHQRASPPRSTPLHDAQSGSLAALPLSSLQTHHNVDTPDVVRITAAIKALTVLFPLEATGLAFRQVRRLGRRLMRSARPPCEHVAAELAADFLRR
jgi:hypothetical protein